MKGAKSMKREQNKTHKLWARIGITVLVTEDEYNKLKKQTTVDDQVLTDEQAKWFITNGYADGESYIPEEVFEHEELNLI